MNLSLLKTEIETPQYAGKGAAEIAALLNAANIAYFVEVPTPEVTNFLMNAGLYAKLLAVYRDHVNPVVRVAAEGALDLAQSQIPFVNVQNPTIQHTLPVLVQEKIWTQAEADALVNYARRFRSRAVELVGQNVTAQDVNAARWLDQTAAFEARIALLVALKADLETGNAYHELNEVQ